MSRRDTSLALSESASRKNSPNTLGRRPTSEPTGDNQAAARTVANDDTGRPKLATIGGRLRFDLWL